MKHSMEFELAWQGLKPGVHVYEYEVGMDFMALHGEARHEYKELQAQVKLRFDKHDGFFQLHFDIGGHIITPCDRCGDDFRMELWDEFNLIVKLTGGDEDQEQDEDADVVFIPRSETVIDVSNWIYEFIILSIPIQRIHPNDSEGRPGCNEAALKLLGTMSEHKEEKKNDIWKGLESIRISDNNKRK